jgi:23S rRNA-/tRNA-specific pseudouridylate synthase
LLPRSLLEKLIRKGAFSVVGAAADAPLVRSMTSACALEPGSCLVCSAATRSLLSPPVAAAVAAAPNQRPPPSWVAGLAVLHHSRHLLAVSKPAGLPTQSGDGGEQSIEAALKFLAPPPEGRLRIVHRLDTSVSGVVLLAKTLAGARALSAALREASLLASAAPPAAMVQGKGLRKGYIGLVVSANPGLLSAASLRGSKRVSLALEGSSIQGTVRAGVRTHDDKIEQGVTRFAVGARGREGSHFLTALFLEPLTGRRHQLRQHTARTLCAGAGGLYGDAKYGGEAPRGDQPPGGSVFLHAAQVQIGGGLLPGDEEGIVVAAPLPQSWGPVLSRFGVRAEALEAGLARFLAS